MIVSRRHCIITPPPFDPAQYMHDVATNPSAFVSMGSICASVMALRTVKKAESMETLKTAYQTAHRAAKKAGDVLLLEMLTAAKDKRKAEL